MTEHFTREEAVTKALEKCERVATESGAYESYRAVGEAFQELRNAIAKQAEWEAQGAVDVLAIPDKPWCKDLTLKQLILHLELAKREPPYIVRACLTAAEMLKHIEAQGPLYTHALPAQPAEPVNAELVDAISTGLARVFWGDLEIDKSLKLRVRVYDDEQGEPFDKVVSLVAKEVAAALSRAQAAQPVVEVPNGWKLVPIDPARQQLVTGWHAISGKLDHPTLAHLYAVMIADAPKHGGAK